MEYLLLSEATLVRLLWRSWRGRPTRLLGVWSRLTGGPAGWLTRLAERLPGVELAPADPGPIPTDIRIILGTDAFATAEPALDRIYRLDEAERRFGRYGLAYRHAVCSRAMDRLVLVHRIRELCGPGDVVAGLEPEDAALYRATFGNEPPVAAGAGWRWPFAVATALLGLAAGLAFVASRTRLNPPAPEAVLLGSDFCADGRDDLLWQEVTDDPAQVVPVCRNAAIRVKGAQVIEGRRACLRTDGVFSPAQALAACAELAADVAMLLAQGGGLPSDVFRALAVLPYKRMIFRGLFNRFRFRFFWDRSDYNTEHMMCSQELRAVGGRAMGLMHGLPSIANKTHQLRYLDYDVYFAMGGWQAKHVYRDRWPAHMAVRVIGSFGMTRDELHRLAAPRPLDMAWYLVPWTQGTAGLQALDRMAEAFPDRRMYVNIKPRQLEPAYREALDAVMARRPNVSLRQGRAYDLFFDTTYVFSEGSTLVAEAVQFGHLAFNLDLVPASWKTNYYRAFPEMNLASAEQAIDRVRALEAGAWTYPRAAFADMIDLSGRVFYDLVREEMGLAPREGALPHLDFTATTPQGETVSP